MGDLPGSPEANVSSAITVPLKVYLMALSKSFIHEALQRISAISVVFLY
jgi:hypothetical protein